MKKTVPIFYAADDKYLSYLAVCLTSVKENARRGCDYRIYVLHAGMEEKEQGKLACFNDEDFTVAFVDVSADLKALSNRLHMRDYYTSATYFRIFIAGLFPQYDKALYLDSDVIVRGDICELFDTPLGDTLVGAVPDGAVAMIPPFRAYTKDVLGIDAENYFNAGILVMNLKKFREIDFYGKFADLLGKYAFTVAQDQDYLNVLCKDSVTYLPTTWNAMPTGNHQEKDPPKLIHYNLTAKPWHYDDILYQEEFWSYAARTEYYEELLAELKGYTEEYKQRDKDCEVGLIALAVAETEREDNYYKKYVKNK